MKNKKISDNESEQKAITRSPEGNLSSVPPTIGTYMTTPHSSWAEFYDTAYEQSFGNFYNQFTNETIKQIESCVQPPARIVDFGAGTGRLSIPLVSRGYEVVAVDSCKEMLAQLSKKQGGERVTTFLGRMQDFQTDAPFDMAICVFTVLLYLLDEESLEKSIQAVANALRPGGLLLIDIPLNGVFQSYHSQTPEINRSITILPQGGNLYFYHESTMVTSCGRSYSDKFMIRHWEAKHVMKVLANHNFLEKKSLTAAFSGTGSQYFLMKKINGAE